MAGQLAALQEAGLPPATIAADDILVEDVGGRERAWLLPDPLRAVGDDAASATRSLGQLLGDTVGRPLVTDPPSDPQTLSELLASQADGHATGAGWLSAGRSVIAGHRGARADRAMSSPSRSRATTRRRTQQICDDERPERARHSRIPLNATTVRLATGPKSAWIATPDGTLLHIDRRRIRCSASRSPRSRSSRTSTSPSTATSCGRAARSNCCVWTHRPDAFSPAPGCGKRAVSGLLISNGSVWATLNDDPRSPDAKVVRFDPATGRSSTAAPSFGIFPIPGERARTASSGRSAVTGPSRASDGRRAVDDCRRLTGRFPGRDRRSVWIPTRIDRTVVIVDPSRMTPRGVVHLDGDTMSVTAGAGSMWVLTANPSRIYRVDPATSQASWLAGNGSDGCFRARVRSRLLVGR